MGMRSLQRMKTGLPKGRSLRHGLGALVALGLSCFAAAAQDYPNKPIEVYVPFPAGGGSDIVARAVSDIMGRELGQPLVVENHGGANGAIGTRKAKAAAPDGYTLYIGNLGTMAITPNLDKNAQYNPVEDFEAVTQINASSTILVVHPKLGINSFEEFIAYAKENPGKLNYGSSSPATVLPMEMLKQMAEVDITHIPYKGSGPAMTDLLAGHIDVMFGGAIATIPHVKSNALVALAVAGSSRNHILPELRTVAEAGFPDFAADSWNGIFVPKGTAPELIALLNKAAVKALQDPSVSSRMENEGAVVIANSPEEFQAYVGAEFAKWKAVIDGLDGGIELN